LNKAQLKRAAQKTRGPKSQMQIVLLFDPSRKNAQDKPDTICQNLPESAVTPAEAEEGQCE
jgi:hypothetical protein